MSGAHEDAQLEEAKENRRRRASALVDPTFRAVRTYTYPGRAVKYSYSRKFREYPGDGGEGGQEIWLADNLWLKISQEEDEDTDELIWNAELFLWAHKYKACVEEIRTFLSAFKDEETTEGDEHFLRVPKPKPKGWSHAESSLDITLKRINVLLMSCCCYLVLGKLKKALNDSVEAFRIANSVQMLYMIGKCRVYIGICLSRLHRWEEAVAAFNLASEVQISGWEGRMGDLKLMAQSSLTRQRIGLRELDKASCLGWIWNTVVSL